MLKRDAEKCEIVTEELVQIWLKIKQSSSQIWMKHKKSLISFESFFSLLLQIHAFKEQLKNLEQINEYFGLSLVLLVVVVFA